MKEKFIPSERFPFNPCDLDWKHDVKMEIIRYAKNGIFYPYNDEFYDYAVEQFIKYNNRDPLKEDNFYYNGGKIIR